MSIKRADGRLIPPKVLQRTQYGLLLGQVVCSYSPALITHLTKKTTTTRFEVQYLGLAEMERSPWGAAEPDCRHWTPAGPKSTLPESASGLNARIKSCETLAMD